MHVAEGVVACALWQIRMIGGFSASAAQLYTVGYTLACYGSWLVTFPAIACFMHFGVGKSQCSFH